MRSEQRPEDFGIGRLFWVTSDAIVGADVASERVVLWNPAAEAMFGYPASEALGMPLVRLVAPESRDAHLAGIRRYRDGHAPTLVGAPQTEVVAVRADGTRLDAALTLADVSPDGSRRHVIAVIRDMSDVRRAQDALQRMNEAMEEFVATAAHDLRTPLATVSGFARLLSTTGESLTAERRQEFAEAILRGSERATRLVDDLLTLSQIEAGAVTTHAEITDVADATAEAVRMTGTDAEVSVEDGLVARIDRHHLERMLTNLLTNALRYGRPPIHVRAGRQDDAVEIRVSDCGEGVPHDFVPRLFDRFARASSTKAESTGLGLSIVRGLAIAHGGDAFYTTTDTGGAVFGLRLLAAPDHTP